jgi:hypothetical protein
MYMEQQSNWREPKVIAMIFAELPSDQRLDFESPEALANAIQHMRAGTPLIVRDEKDGSRAVLWAPGDED